MGLRNIIDMLKGKKFPLGTISHRKDGDFKKVAEGKWEQVIKTVKGKKVKSAPKKKKAKKVSAKEKRRIEKEKLHKKWDKEEAEKQHWLENSKGDFGTNEKIIKAREKFEEKAYKVLSDVAISRLVYKTLSRSARASYNIEKKYLESNDLDIRKKKLDKEYSSFLKKLEKYTTFTKKGLKYVQEREKDYRKKDKATQKKADKALEKMGGSFKDCKAKESDVENYYKLEGESSVYFRLAIVSKSIKDVYESKLGVKSTSHTYG